MPWPHCNDPAIEDDLACPECGMTKQEWSIKVEITRIFRVGAKKACKVVVYRPDGTTYAAGLSYRIELPDGTVAEGELNPAGYAKAECKLPGDAVVTFPGQSVTLVDPTAGTRTSESSFRCGVEGKYEFRLVAGQWVELTLVDDRGLPVPDEPYVARLANGTQREGTLDAKGHARLDDLPDGDVEVVYPRRDGLDWLAPLQRSLAIELLDEAGRPVPDAPFVVRLPDGTLREGTLDRDGQARLEGLPTREVEVAFPGRDRTWDLVDRFPDLGPPPPEPPPAPRFSLQTEAGLPVIGARFVVRASDGRVFEGQLDDAGEATVLALVGTDSYEVCFPDLEDWAPPAPPAPREPGPLDLALVLPDGTPVAHAPYRVRTADDRVFEGQLDERGQATLLGIGGDTCEVSFPGVDAFAAFVARPVTPPAPPLDALELELRDGAGKPVPHARYLVRTDDGVSLSGLLDERGRASVRGLPNDQVEVSFPDFDEALTTSGRAVVAGGPLELALVLPDGTPVALAPYRVRTADGRVFEGQLDERGQATLDGLGGDTCEVSFPGVDAFATFVARPPVTPPAPPPDALELELRDGAGKPVPHARYLVRTDDGVSLAGLLDERGRASVHGLPNDQVDVTFPDFDEALTASGREVVAGGPLELDLRGLDGRPLAFAPFVVRTDDGRTFTGVLDADGLATIPGLSLDSCEVSFPGLDCEAVASGALGTDPLPHSLPLDVALKQSVDPVPLLAPSTTLALEPAPKQGVDSTAPLTPPSSTLDPEPAPKQGVEPTPVTSPPLEGAPLVEEKKRSTPKWPPEPETTTTTTTSPQKTPGKLKPWPPLQQTTTQEQPPPQKVEPGRRLKREWPPKTQVTDAPRPIVARTKPPAEPLALSLRDERGRPVAGAPYRVRTEDGRLLEGRLDDAGEALVADAGASCEITFPEHLNFEPPEGGTLVGEPLVVELRDARGGPMPWARYRVRTDDGRERAGFLDGEGRAVVADLAGATCEVTFPGLETGFGLRT